MQRTAHSSTVPRKPGTAPLRPSVSSQGSNEQHQHKPGRPHFVSPLPGQAAATTPPAPALRTSSSASSPRAAATTSSALVTMNAAAVSAAAATAPSKTPTSGRTKPSLISPAQKAHLQASSLGFGGQKSGRAAAGEQSSTTVHGGGGAGFSSSATAGLSHSAVKRAAATHTKGANDPTVPVVAVGPERDSAAFRLCCEALSEGCVQTYMHLFHLAHRDPVCVDALAHTYFSVPPDRLVWVQQQLSAVEVLRRQSEFSQVLDRCLQLADYFEAERDEGESRWCYAIALQHMSDSLDRTLEQGARQRFAAFEERHGHLEAAAALYEAMQRQAVALRDVEAIQSASQCLVRVYQALGDAAMAHDPAAAAAYFSKVRVAAERGADTVQECAAYSALGDVSEARGDYPRALAYNRSYRAVAQREGLPQQECHATLRVADLEERLGLRLEASATLQEALQLAKDLGEPRQLCRATMQLGEAYRARGQEEEALRCFEESFEAAMRTGEQELVEKARIAIGFARGDHSLAHAFDGKGYLQLVCTDIRAQLAWMSGGTL